MPRLLGDQNFDDRILDGLLRRLPDLVVIKLRDVVRRDSDDEVVLATALEHDCVLVTHDKRTMPGHMAERAARGMSLPRVVIVPKNLGVGRAIEEIEVLLLAGTEADWQQNPWRLPL